MMRQPSVLAFGEILFDCYPPRGNAAAFSKIGGAPFNYAAHFACLGGRAELLSAVGQDSLGEEARAHMHTYGVGDRFLMTHASRPTGQCTVSYDAAGEPHYDLRKDGAYFDVSVPDACAVREGRFDALYFGSLALTNGKNLETVKALLATGAFPTVLCDINLRPGLFDADVLRFCLAGATVCKINRDELAVLRRDFLPAAPGEDLTASCAAICRAWNISLLVVTLDAEGAAVYVAAEEKLYHSPKPSSRLLSAVGAGDSFFACFTRHYLAGAPIERALSAATALSDFVVTREEAVPAYPEALLPQIL